MSSASILGGGFGGITVATELRRGPGEGHEITPLDRGERFRTRLRKLWRLVGALCLLVLWPAAGPAKETDSFRHRYQALAFPEGEVAGRPLSDFSAEFNELLGPLFSRVLEDLNRENRRGDRSCLSAPARRRLFHKLSARLGGPVIFSRNRLRPAITHHPNRFQPAMSSSIYRDFAPWRSISLGLATKLGTKLASLYRFDLERVLVESGGGIARAPDGRLVVLGPEGAASDEVYRLRAAEPQLLEHEGRTYYLLDNGQALVDSAGEIRRVTPILVSSDKFSHFFNRSLGLFKRLRAGDEEDVERVLARNFRLEVSLYGSKSTGLAAYGDLVANFQGMRFWIHLLGRGLDGRPLRDPLGGARPRPIVGCSEDGRWVQARPIDIREYLDPAWDEGLNCSRMRSPVLLGQVLRRIEELGSEDELGHSYDCPVDRGLIVETAAGYGRWADLLVNADGHSSLRGEKRKRQ